MWKEKERKDRERMRERGERKREREEGEMERVERKSGKRKERERERREIEREKREMERVLRERDFPVQCPDLCFFLQNPSDVGVLRWLHHTNQNAATVQCTDDHQGQKRSVMVGTARLQAGYSNSVNLICCYL